MNWIKGMIKLVKAGEYSPEQLKMAVKKLMDTYKKLYNPSDQEWKEFKDMIHSEEKESGYDLDGDNWIGEPYKEDST